MGWMSDLVKTYDACEFAAGAGDDAKALMPIGHTLFSTDICINLDSGGNFVDIYKESKKIIAPCTVNSETARTGGACPHALFEQLKYLSNDYSEEDSKYYVSYVKGLEAWASGNPKLEAVLKYIKSGTILTDLENSNANLKRNKDGKIDEGTGIRFAVRIPGDDENELWKDKEIQKRWTQICLNNSGDTEDLDYITGTMSANITDKHPKGIISINKDAKLISSKDDNFKWHGRFTDASQALTVSYESSQKAHKALLWLIENIAFKCLDKNEGSQVIIAWQVGETDDKKPKKANAFIMEKHYDDNYNVTTKTDRIINKTYAEKIRKSIYGFGDGKEKHHKTIDIMALANSSQGRLAITFFEQFPKNAYLDAIASWHETCAWYIPFEDTDKKKHEFNGAPNTDDIISAVHGEKCNVKIKKYEQLRLLHCVFRGEKLPRDMVTAVVNNASNPESFDSNSRFRKVLAVACALTRKYIYDKSDKKELYSMELEKQNTNRDYLWGRLLAIADKIEKKARKAQGVKDDEKRPTNALCYMSAFRAHPFKTWDIIFEQLQPYRERLNGAEWEQQQIDEIMSLFKTDEEYRDNTALDGGYLMGYSLQRREFDKKNKDNKSEEKGNEPE